MTSLLPLVSQATVFAFGGLMLWAAYCDIRSLSIPNWLSIVIALLYPVFVLTSPQPVDWIGALAVAGASLVAGFILFAFRALGGGDAKLLAAGALWAGPALFLHFFVYTALAGGVLAGLFWLRHRLCRLAADGSPENLPVEASFAKQPMPYATAIAAGALYVAFTNMSLG